MRVIGQGRWDIIPCEKARKLPGEASDGYDAGSYSIGYFHKFSKDGVAEWREVFVAARISEEDPAYALYTFAHHPGSFNPRDGGTPPETEEVGLPVQPSGGTFGTLEQVARRVVAVWMQELASNYFENAWEDEEAKHQENIEQIS